MTIRNTQARYKRRKAIYNRSKKSIDKDRKDQTRVQKHTVNLAVYNKLKKGFSDDYAKKVIKTGMGKKAYKKDKRYFK